ncbi:MAG TPA: methyltransferase dimerization domain-containing protein, partial [Terriglobales bacterium]
MEPFRHHVFVCTQVKAEGVTSCSASGSGGMLAALIKSLTDHGLDDDVQVTTCGCMGLCDDGPVMIVYPDGVWYRKLQPGDMDEIVKSHLKDGAIVSRLEWCDATAMKSASLEHRNQYRAMLQARDKAGTLPDDLTELVRSYMPSRVMLTALELDIFSAVGDGATSEVVARTADTNKRATETLLNALVSLGLLTKTNGTYACTAITSRFFRSGSKDNA